MSRGDLYNKDENELITLFWYLIINDRGCQSFGNKDRKVVKWSVNFSRPPTRCIHSRE